MDWVDVTIRQRDGTILSQRKMDRDAAYFQDFRWNAEVDLAEGHSITITPREEYEEATSRVQWNFQPAG